MTTSSVTPPPVRRLTDGERARGAGVRHFFRHFGEMFVAMLVGMWVGAAVAADDVTEDQILRALTPTKKPLTRGLSIGAPAEPAANPAESKFVSSIRGRSTRSLSRSEREEIAAIVQDKPKIDLEINFDYNSADISAKSLASVQALGRALSRKNAVARESTRINTNEIGLEIQAH